MSELIATTCGSSIAIVVDLARGLLAVLADANQLEMAVLNLAVNARDAMPGGGQLVITAVDATVFSDEQGALAPGRYVRLGIGDSGMGMDAATIARAVEPFFSTKGVGRGTGLGLSMVHGLTAQLGGGLTIGSTPGEGSTVAMWLPVVDAAPVAAEVPWAESVVAGAGTALVVDDEDLVRESTAEMLVASGYAVVEARSAAAALALIDDGLAPQLVVTDHLMPGMTGTELARLLQARLPRTPVLLISGYAEDDGIALDLPRLSKPFRQDDLQCAIAAAIGSRPIG